MEEIWRSIKDYEGVYEVSNTGKVRSLNYRQTGKAKELKPTKNTNGYLKVALCKDGKIKHYLVHRLVAKTFLGDWSLWCSDINHIDEDKTNNYSSNLEWCSRKFNLNHGSHNERMVQTNIQKGRFNPDMCGKFDTSDMKEYRRQYYNLYRKAHNDKIKEQQRRYYTSHKKGNSCVETD